MWGRLKPQDPYCGHPDVQPSQRTQRGPNSPQPRGMLGKRREEAEGPMGSFPPRRRHFGNIFLIQASLAASGAFPLTPTLWAGVQDLSGFQGRIPRLLLAWLRLQHRGRWGSCAPTGLGDRGRELWTPGAAAARGVRLTVRGERAQRTAAADAPSRSEAGGGRWARDLSVRCAGSAGCARVTPGHSSLCWHPDPESRHSTFESAVPTPGTCPRPALPPGPRAELAILAQGISRGLEDGVGSLRLVMVYITECAA
nr:uncharacterized protein LOC127487772 [Oryctolagus cuniculus]